MKLFNRNIGILVLILCALILPSCSKKAEGSKEKQSNKENQVKNELVFVEREIACNYDPAFYPGSNHFVKAGVGELLFKVDPDGSIKPSLAKEGKRIDEKTWKITLRPEAVFWSGEKVTADKVIGSLNRSLKTNPKTVKILGGLSYEKIGEFEFLVKTERPNVSVPLKLSYLELCIINPDKAHKSVETMDMTGMYKIKEFKPKKMLIAETFDKYYGAKPKINRIVQEEISDPETRSLSILSKRADIVAHVSNESISQLENDKSVNIHNVPAANTQTIYLNHKNDVLKDKNVRQALSWAIDREKLVKLATEGKSVVTTNWLSSNPKYKDIRNEIYNKVDLEKAANLLKESGYTKNSSGKWEKNGKVLTIRLMTWGQDKTLGESIQSAWNEFGVDTIVKHGDYSLIEAARSKGDWDAFIEAWQTYGDEYDFLSAQYSVGGSGNYGGYESKDIIGKLEELKSSNDESRTKKISSEISIQAAEDVAAIYLHPRIETIAVSAKIKGFVPHFKQSENIINPNLEYVK